MSRNLLISYNTIACGHHDGRDCSGQLARLRVCLFTTLLTRREAQIAGRRKEAPL